MAGKQKVRALVSGALQDLYPQRRSDLPDFVARGMPYAGIQPGKWTPDPKTGLPLDCPVRPLGFDGENYFFVDANGQLFATGDKAFGRERVMKCFGRYAWYLYWAWPAWKMPSAKEEEEGVKPFVNGWKPELATETLFHAIARKGPWRDFEKVRGLGAWTSPDGGLILHRGEHLYFDGKWHVSGVELDGFFYPRRPKLPMPAKEALGEDDPIIERLYAFVAKWNLKRPKTDALFLVGWIAAAMVSGALKWRPSMFLVGDKGTGKSTLQDAVKQIFGDGLISTPNTTAAGIYQHLGSDALPVAVDEIEASTDNRRANAVIELARQAASGGVMLRGGADSVGVEFRARSSFLFSAIVPPPLKPQDLSRMALIMFDTLDINQPPPVLPDPELLAAAMLRRMADRWRSFEAVNTAYRDALRAGGHDARGQDTYGTFLTCAHLVLGESGLERLGFPYEDLTPWGALLEAESLPEREGSQANWRGCLAHLLSAQVPTWRAGERTTVGQLLDDLAAKAGSAHAIEFDYAKRHLAHTGLGLVPAGKACQGLALAIPNSSPLVAGLFRGSEWGGEGSRGSWNMSLRQGPASIIIHDKTKNKIKLNGQSTRCTMVDLEAFEQWGED